MGAVHFDINSGEDLSIKVPADPAAVAGIRREVSERAKTLGADHRVVDDLRTAVSEACNNVVLHAYPDDARDRPLEVVLHGEDDELLLIVRDAGQGIQPPRSGRPLGLRMGLLLVGAISSCFQLRSRRGGGTELVLRMPLEGSSL
jgi:serine/threonine-protein kinase RsbW